MMVSSSPTNAFLVDQAWKFRVHNPWNPECISDTQVGGVLWDLEWWMILPAAPWWCGRFAPQLLLLLLLLISLLSPARQSPSSLVSSTASHTLFAHVSDAAIPNTILDISVPIVFFVFFYCCCPQAKELVVGGILCRSAALWLYCETWVVADHDEPAVFCNISGLQSVTWWLSAL